jgi:hypothetical protein
VTDFYSGAGLGSKIYRTTDGWYLGTPVGAVNPYPGNPSDAHTNFDPAWNSGQGMTYVGDATVSWYMLEFCHNGETVLENNWATWVIELTIPRVTLPTLNPGDELYFRWQPGCRNDGNDAHAFITGMARLTLLNQVPSCCSLWGRAPLQRGSGAAKIRPPSSSTIAQD